MVVLEEGMLVKCRYTRSSNSRLEESPTAEDHVFDIRYDIFVQLLGQHIKKTLVDNWQITMPPTTHPLTDFLPTISPDNQLRQDLPYVHTPSPYIEAITDRATWAIVRIKPYERAKEFEWWLFRKVDEVFKRTELPDGLEVDSEGSFRGVQLFFGRKHPVWPQPAFNLEAYKALGRLYWLLRPDDQCPLTWLLRSSYPERGLAEELKHFLKIVVTLLEGAEDGAYDLRNSANTCLLHLINGEKSILGQLGRCGGALGEVIKYHVKPVLALAHKETVRLV